MGRTSSPLQDRLIFLVGSRRSGTNWLQRILGAHPDVYCVPAETTLFSAGLQPLADRFQHTTMSSPQPGTVFIDREVMLDALRDLCDSVFSGLEPQQTATKRILERTPDHVHHLPLIGAVYPDARFVHIIRDGRDVARSLVSQPWGPTTLREAASDWRAAVEAGRRDASVVKDLIEVRYEELLASPATWVPKLHEALGLETSDEIVEATLNEAGVRFNVDAEAPQIESGKWRSSFSQKDLEDVMAVAGPLLVELGYASSDEVPTTSGPEDSQPSRSIARRLNLKRDTRAHVREARVRVRQGLTTMNRFLESAQQDPTGLAALLDPRATTRVVSSGSDREAKGTAGAALLAETFAADPAMKARQVRGDIYPSVPSFTFVATYETEGARYERVLIVSVSGERVDRCVYYMLDPDKTNT
jgi:hypothetical protein